MYIFDGITNLIKKKQMKKITNLIIVDASGSMYSKTKEVKNGLTELLQDIRKDMKENKGKAKVRTIIVQFSSNGFLRSSNESDWFKVLLDTKKRKKIKFDCVENYQATGGTALYDAIGESFAMVGKKQDGVFVSILTDGDENSSKEYTSEDVKKLLKEADDKKWGVTFMGTTKQAIESAKSLGVSSSNTFLYEDSGQGTNSANVSRKMSRQVYTASVMKGNVRSKGLVEDQVEENETDSK